MNHPTTFDVIIIGGGLAGLTCALHLSQKNIGVLLVEKNSYPKHKVCGEYVSNEVLPYLNSLGVYPLKHGAKPINHLEITTRKNKKTQTKLPLGGFGMSRYYLDNLLVEKAINTGTKLQQQTVTEVKYKNDAFQIVTKEGAVYDSKFVIGAFGKRSNLDKKLDRKFIQEPSNYLGVKTHVKGKFPANKVALHNFKGGYCGVSKVENNHLNLCYITSYKSFKKHKSIKDFQEKVMYKNKVLQQIFKDTTPVFSEPLSISQISFKAKPLVENHILMCGDSAAMIHPLCGNGMGMAISSAKLLSTILVDFFAGKINSRKQVEKIYLSQWNTAYRTRLFFGRLIATIFKNDTVTHMLWYVVQIFPGLIPLIIAKTHGKMKSE